MEKTAIYAGGFFILLDEENGPMLYREGFYNGYLIRLAFI